MNFIQHLLGQAEHASGDLTETGRRGNGHLDAGQPLDGQYNRFARSECKYTPWRRQNDFYTTTARSSYVPTTKHRFIYKAANRGSSGQFNKSM